MQTFWKALWGGGEASFLWGKKRKKSLPNLPNTIYYSVSDHYFAALVNVRAVGAPDRCQLGKTGGSQTIWNSHLGALEY